MTESNYQAYLIRKLHEMFPGCVVLKNDANYMQGIPDLVVFFFHMYAFLEVKTSADAPEQANQDYYVRMLDEMSFAAFIYPENERLVLDELQLAFNANRSARIS